MTNDNILKQEIKSISRELIEIKKELINNEDVKQLQSLLQQIYGILLISNFNNIQSFFKMIFNEPVDFLIYQKSDGNKTTRQIANEIKIEIKNSNSKVSKDKVSQRWKIWDSLGLVRSIGKQRQAIFNLNDFGILGVDKNE